MNQYIRLLSFVTHALLLFWSVSSICFLPNFLRLTLKQSLQESGGCHRDTVEYFKRNIKICDICSHMCHLYLDKYRFIFRYQISKAVLMCEMCSHHNHHIFIRCLWFWNIWDIKGLAKTNVLKNNILHHLRLTSVSSRNNPFVILYI